MGKFSIGSIVKYNGENEFLKIHFGSGMTVVDVIPDGCPIGNGEVNKSGQPLYRLQAPSKVMFNFLEDELCLSQIEVK